MAIYARQSVDRDNSISVESQVEFCKYELRGAAYKEYADKGFSGKSTNRPAFKAMLEDIQQGQIETVIVYKLDRISRSILDFSTMMEFFKQYGVEFISSTEKFDTSSPIGRAMLNICVVFAQLERETIQKRVADAYYSRSKKGLYMGGQIPYGFKLKDAKIDGVKTASYDPIEQEVEQIRLIYALYSQPNVSLTDVVRYMNEHDIKHLRGKSWTTSRLSGLIRTPIYVRADSNIYEFYKKQGTNIINDSRDFIGVNACYLYKKEMANRKQSDLSDKQVVLAPHEGIVSSEEWLRCRLKCLSNRQFALPRKPKNSWLAGKTKCGKCGYALTVRRNRQDRRYFVCISRMGYSSVQCKGPGTLHVENIEEIISYEIKKKLGEFKELHPPQMATVSSKIAENKVEIRQIETEIRTLVDKVLNADVELMKHINVKVSSLEQNRELLLDANLSLSSDSMQNPMLEIEDHMKLWESLEINDRMLVVDALIDKILIDEMSIEISWKI